MYNESLEVKLLGKMLVYIYVQVDSYVLPTKKDVPIDFQSNMSNIQA